MSIRVCHKCESYERAVKQKNREVEAELENCAAKAMDALSRYKFWMFGYWAAMWVNINRLHPVMFGRKNPFRELVKFAQREMSKE